MQVLACCIILVFFLGVFRLWRTNRALRQLEVIDEEKRNRLSMLSHCGVDARRPPEIPFGIRAIQNGIEVEGIWISRPNTPDISMVASSPTLVGTTTLFANETRTSKGKEKMTNADSTENTQIDFTIEDSHMLCLDTLLSANVPQVVLESELDPGSNSYTQNPPVSSQPQTNPSPSPSISEINKDDQQKSDSSKPQSSNDPFTTPSDTPTLDSIRLSSCQSSETEPSITESTLQRSAEVIVKRNARGANRLCAVVPAGSGRRDLDKNSGITEDEGRGTRPRIHKLNRKPSFVLLRKRSIEAKEQLSSGSSSQNI